MIGFGLNLPHQGRVGGLGFQYVGDGNQACIEALPLLQLAFDCGDLGIGGVRSISCSQNVQVGIRHPDDQILFLCF